MNKFSAIILLLLLGCGHDTSPVNAPSEKSYETSTQTDCDQVYNRILAIKTVSMGYNDLVLMSRLDEEYRDGT